jgi:hypothetical protein
VARLVGALRTVHAAFRAGQRRLAEGLLKLVKGKVKKRGGSSKGADVFLDRWCTRVMRSRLEPMKKVARMQRRHRELILNWFRARGQLSAGAVEGLNGTVRVITKRACGFRTYRAVEVALYHHLGRLPEPDFTHRFC